MQTFSEKKVQDMIAEVDSAIETLLKSEKDALIKLQKGASGVSIPQTQDAANGGLAKGGEDASAAPVAEDKEKAPDASPSAAPADAGPGPAADPMASADPAAPAGDPAAAPGADASASAPPTEQELVEAYGQLSQPELQLHAKALASVMAAQAGAQSPAAPAPGPSAGPAAPPASPSPAGPGASPLPADQSMPVDPSVAAMKSENVLLRGQVADLQKGLAAFTDGFKELLAPKQKAVTGMDIVPETPKQSLLHLTKSEIGTKLAAVVKTDLAKSDRKLINRWYNGDASDAELTHLLSK